MSLLIFPYIDNGLIVRSSSTDSDSTSTSRSSSDDEKTDHRVSAQRTSNSKHVKNKLPKNLGMQSVPFSHLITSL
jgi:hypothetical protein